MLEKNRGKNSKLSSSVFVLISIIILGFIVRFYYMPENIPLTLDGLRYFFYGMDISVIGNLPKHFDFSNNGWPLFLSLLFQIFRFEDYIDFMTLQRVTSIGFSILTAIPIYFLSKRFFNSHLALIGASFFIFSPYIIENSLLGVTESLFVFLIVNFLALFFSTKKIHVMLSFVILGLSVIVRYESLLLIVPVILVFLHRYRSEKNFRRLVFVGLGLFLLVIIPMALWRLEVIGNDGLISNFVGAGNVAINPGVYKDATPKFEIIRAIVNLPKFIAASLLPICFIFVPYSLIVLKKKENREFQYLILIGIFALIPAFYAYARGFEEFKYVFVLFPFFIISSLFLIQKIILKVKKKESLVYGLILLIIISSVIFTDFRKADVEHENEALQIAQFVSKLNGKINDYGKESYFIEPMNLKGNKFPTLSTEIDFKTEVVVIRGTTINEMITDAKNKELSYLAITDSNQILSKIYDEEHNYLYLEKIYDSKENNLKFNIKIFKIDFNKFEI